MTKNMNKTNSNIRGVGFLVLASLIFSLQNVAVKWIGGDYSVLEIVVFRSLVALPCTLLFYRFEGQRGLPTTQRHNLEYVRGSFLFLSYTTYMMGLAALPLAEIASILFSGPLMITFLSVVMLGEKVGPRHWLALLIGLSLGRERDARGGSRAVHVELRVGRQARRNRHVARIVARDGAVGRDVRQFDRVGRDCEVRNDQYLVDADVPRDVAIERHGIAVSVRVVARRDRGHTDGTGRRRGRVVVAVGG